MKSNIRKLRNEKQISQATLANVIGKTQQTVSHMELDRDRIPIESLITLADYFGVSTDCVLGIEGEKSKTAGKESCYPSSAGREDLKGQSEGLKGVVMNGDRKLLVELILSLLICSLNEKNQSP